MGDTAVPGGPPGFAPGRGALWQQSRGGDWSAATAAAGPAIREGLELAYQVHYPSLVRLAALLTGDAGLGEQVAEDAFVAVFSSPVLSGRAKAHLAALLRLVVAGSRQAVRRSPVGAAGPGQAAAGERTEFARLPVVLALCALPHAQREAVVLTYYLDLDEAQAAAAAAVSRAALRRNLGQAVDALSGVLDAAG